MGMNHLSFGYEASKLWVRIILALGTNDLNFGYESSGYETSVGTKRPVSGAPVSIRMGSTAGTSKHPRLETEPSETDTCK